MTDHHLIQSLMCWTAKCFSNPQQVPCDKKTIFWLIKKRANMTAALVVFILLVALMQPSMSLCPPLQPHNATHIFELKPTDIKVVLAMGDSITAGFSINNSIWENRGGLFKKFGYKIFVQNPGPLAVMKTRLQFPICCNK